MTANQLRSASITIMSIVIILVSCSPKQVVTVGIPAVDAREKPPIVSSIDWLPKRDAAISQYLIDDSSTISMSADSIHTSSFQTTTLYSLTVIALADSFLITASVDSMSTNPPASARKNGTAVFSPDVSHAVISNTGHISIVASNKHSVCQDGADPAAMRIVELIHSYPKRRITIGDRWADTISTTSCRGKTSLHQQIIREYELLELTNWKQHDVAKIQSNVTSMISGNGSDSRNQLNAIGSGRSSAILYVDRTNGILRESNERSESTLTITTSRGSYPFTQRIETHIQIQ